MFRGQTLSPADSSSRSRGASASPSRTSSTSSTIPEHADILILSNVQKDGKPIGLADAGTYFHTDYSYLDVPARCTMLYSIAGAEQGRRYAVRRTSTPPMTTCLDAMKNAIEDLVALHHYGNRDDLDKASRTVASVLTEEQEQKMAWVRHRSRASTRSPAARRSTRSPAARSASRACPTTRRSTCCDELKRHATQEKYQLRLKYGVGDVVIWDNASLLHSATLTDPNDPRTLWRITVKEERNHHEESLLLLPRSRSIRCSGGAGARRRCTARRSSTTTTPSPRRWCAFEELVKKYYGKPINFVLHKNSELGLEKQYFEYMAQGKAVDYAIVSPAHMSTFSKAAPFIDAPFLFRDLDHWNKVLDADLLKPVADEIDQKAEVMLIGYAGGGTRNIFVNKPVRNLAEMKGLKVRVQGAPIWSRDLPGHRHGADRDRLQRGLQRDPEQRHRRGRERGRGRRGDEVLRGRAAAVDDAARDHHPAAVLLDQDLQEARQELQAAVLKAGKEAGAYGRQVESSEDEQKLDAMEKEGKLKRVPFADRAQMKKLADPVMAAYAKEIGAEDIFNKINALK